MLDQGRLPGQLHRLQQLQLELLAVEQGLPPAVAPAVTHRQRGRHGAALSAEEEEEEEREVGSALASPRRLAWSALSAQVVAVSDGSSPQAHPLVGGAAALLRLEGTAATAGTGTAGLRQWASVGAAAGVAGTSLSSSAPPPMAPPGPVPPPACCVLW